MEEEKVEKREEVKDLHSIYMENLLDMSKTESEQSYYRHVLQSINIGRVLLPEKYDKLKKQAEYLIKSRETYPDKRQMELTEGKYYRLGSKGTGSIMARPEELEKGLSEAINQQCNELTPFLKEIDNQIFEILVNEEVIRGKRPEIEEFILEKFMKKMRAKNNGNE